MVMGGLEFVLGLVIANALLVGSGVVCVVVIATICLYGYRVRVPRLIAEIAELKSLAAELTAP
jgi:hypothetical protein